MNRFGTIAVRLLVVPPILLGVAVLVWLLNAKPTPQLKPAAEAVRAVRVIEVAAIDLVPVADGFGTVQPARVWSAVAEVAGRVVEVHPRLRNGAILPAGTALLRIDPVDYELSIAQARAQLAELEVQEANARASLKIEQRSLELIERESKRVDDLVSSGTLSQNQADSTTRSVLGIRAQVQNLRNTLALIPVQRKNLETQLARAERDLQQTRIVAPFAMRVAALAVERDQYVGVGQKLFEGDSVDRVEVLAQFPMAQIRNLVLGRTDLQIDVNNANTQLAELVGFKPTVLLDTGQNVAEWEAEFARMNDTIDPQTRTIGMVVAVDDPFAKTIPGVRPPLTKGMFVRVRMSGRSQPDRMLVPRAAVRNGAVYVADSDDRLRRRTVEVEFSQGDLSVIASGLQIGDRVVVTDVVPAVEGMLLLPQIDRELSSRLVAAGDS